MGPKIAALAADLEARAALRHRAAGDGEGYHATSPPTVNDTCTSTPASFRASSTLARLAKIRPRALISICGRRTMMAGDVASPSIVTLIFAPAFLPVFSLLYSMPK